MSDLAPARLPGVTITETAYQWFCRLVAAYCFVFGLLYWVRLIGLYEGSLWRFDLMPVHWQIAGVVLSVLFPIAAIGLWTMVSWGPVIWFVAAATEAGMFGGFPELFGDRPMVVALHIATVIIFVGFRAVLFWQNRKSREPV